MRRRKAVLAVLVAYSVGASAQPAKRVPALALSPSATPPHSKGLQLAGCKVTNIYGVPLKLTQADIAKLGFRYKKRLEKESEESIHLAFDIIADDGIVVTAVFSLIDDGLLFLRTTSDKAVDPRGVKVGDSLEVVRKAWPDGILQLPIPGAEGITEPRYLTSSNVTLRLRRKAGRGSTLSVRAMEFVDFVPFEALSDFKGC